MVTTEAKPERASQSRIDTDGPFVSVKLKLPESWPTTDDALLELSDLNTWQVELTADGELLIMSPESPESSERGGEIHIDVGIWNRKARNGHVFGAQLGVRSDDGSLRAPDVAWMSNERWAQRDSERGFLNVCPEFVVEVVSPSNSFTAQQQKMQEWLGQGALLAWLIDPYQEIVVVYRPDAEPETLDRPETLSGEDVCEGLEVNLERIWK